MSARVDAAVNVQQVGGWFESGYVTWTAAAPEYNVYVAPAGTDNYVKLDDELIREYPGYVRADVLGLKAGDYQFKIVPAISGVEEAAEATVTTTFTAAAHDRSGFAHVGMSEGIGAYKNDGTLKADAKVLYVWADNAKTVSTQVKTGSKDSNITTCTGLQAIIAAYQKGYDTTPLDIRIIGTIKKDDMDALGSSAEGLQVKGKNAYSPMPITLEGVGNDAGISGFGVLIRNCKGTEFRNFAVMLCMDDCLSLDTENSNIWIHNMDFFYGSTGGDSDQAKGDGTVDIKGHTKNVTLSYNHFYDSGKSSLGGMSGEQTDAWHTYHHNWFDHSDSRHPRIRVQFFHTYNNYYDGVSKYGVGCTTGGSAFVEANYFRNTKYPMLISKQGTDAEGDGTFSGEPGGVIKAYNNTIINPRKVQYYNGSQTDGKWDAVLVNSRNEAVSVTALSGGSAYNSEADQAARTTYIENKMDEPGQVPAIVKGDLGAGRMQHGDFTWSFCNSQQDENYGVIAELKTALQNYKSTLVGFYGGSKIKNGGATKTVDAGDGKGLDPEQNDAYVPTWAGGDGSGVGPGAGSGVGDAVIGGDDYFWFNADNQAAVNAYLADGTITLDEGSAFKPTVEVVNSNGESYSEKIGSLQLAKSTGYAIFYNAEGISKMSFYLARTGSMTGKVLGSKDGTSYDEIQSYSASKGTYELSVTTSGKGYCYYKITNAATGSLHVQGIKLYKAADDDDTGGGDIDDPVDPDPEDPEDPEDPDPEDPDDPEMPGDPVTDAIYCDFTGSKPSSDMVSVSGNYSTSKGSVTYEGTTYSTCVKMESATVITIKPTFDCTVTLVFDVANKRINLDGTTCTTDANALYTFEATARTTYTLKKGDTMNLFLIVFTPKQGGAAIVLNAEGFATFSAAEDVQISGAKVYVAKVSNGVILCQEVEDGIVPAYNGVILYGEANASIDTQSATASAATLEGNELLATTTADGVASVSGQYNYVLNGNSFKHFTGSSFTEGKAYLHFDAEPDFGSSARIVFDGEQGIEAIATDASATVLYDLQGRRLQDMQRGIVIINGKPAFIR